MLIRLALSRLVFLRLALNRFSLAQFLQPLFGFGVVRIVIDDNFIPVGGGFRVGTFHAAISFKMVRIVFTGVGQSDARVAGLGFVRIKALGDVAVLGFLGGGDHRQHLLGGR